MSKIKIFIFLLALPGAAATAEPGYDIVVIGGQSNAVGAGRGSFRDELRSDALDARIFQLGRDIPGCVEDGGHIVPATETLEHWQNCPATGWVGFGLPFARRWAASPLSQGRKVLLVPGAFGGTSSLQWRDSLWPALKAQVAEAMQAGTGRNRVVAFLWSQGETDLAACVDSPGIPLCGFGAGLPVREQWRDRLLAIFRDFRAAFDPEGRAPVLATGFVPDWTELRVEDPERPCRSSDGVTLDDANCFTTVSILANKRAFESTLRRIEEEQQLPGFHFVDTTGLPSNRQSNAGLQPGVLPLYFNESHIHFSAQGQVDLAQRLWERIERRQGKPFLWSR